MLTKVPFDYDTFAENLAKALGGKIVRDEMQSVAGVNRDILIDEATGLYVHLSSQYEDRGKIIVSAYNRKAYKLRNNRAIQWPEATVSHTRDWKGLVADITRRVVTPAKEADAALAIQLKAEGDETADATKKLADLSATLPLMRIKPNENPTSGADLYVNTGGCYMSGRVSVDGTFSASHVSLSREMLEAVHAVMAQRAGK